MFLYSSYSSLRIVKLRNFIKSLLGIGAIFTLSGCIYISINESPLGYKETKTLTLDAQNLQLFEIDAAAGFLIVKGQQNSSQIEVTADIVAVDSNIKFSLESNGNSAILIADANQNNITSRGNGNFPKIDLTITVPADINLKINDGSGIIVIDNVNQNVTLNDGSGSISISNVAGNVDIVDGSGSINASNINGYFNVEDGSGSMDITSINGLVTIDDGSGSINVSQLKGGLTIINGGSGGFKMGEVEGPVTIN